MAWLWSTRHARSQRLTTQASQVSLSDVRPQPMPSSLATWTPSMSGTIGRARVHGSSARGRARTLCGVHRTPEEQRLACPGRDRSSWLYAFHRLRFRRGRRAESDTAAFCNGAYVRAAHRGQRAGKTMLQAALEHYERLGLNALYTNFEAFNPEAACFWPRYFRPVCLSLMRVPEVLPVISDSDRIGS